VPCPQGGGPVLAVPIKADLSLPKKVGLALNSETKEKIEILEPLKAIVNRCNSDILVINISEKEKKFFGIR
jgi:hypothetical protein